MTHDQIIETVETTYTRAYVAFEDALRACNATYTVETRTALRDAKDALDAADAAVTYLRMHRSERAVQAYHMTLGMER